MWVTANNQIFRTQFPTMTISEFPTYQLLYSPITRLLFVLERKWRHIWNLQEVLHPVVLLTQKCPGPQCGCFTQHDTHIFALKHSSWPNCDTIVWTRVSWLRRLFPKIHIFEVKLKHASIESMLKFKVAFSLFFNIIQSASSTLDWMLNGLEWPIRIWQSAI